MAGIRIAGLWEKKSDKGVVYYEGSWGNAMVRVYNNDYKKGPNDPDVVVYLSEKPKDGKRPGGPPQSKAPFGKPSSGPTPKPGPSVPPRMPYKEHTAPPEDETPWPGESDLPF